METIKVLKAVQGKFGPQVLVEGGKYVSFSKQFQGNTNLVPGSYQVDMFTGKTGNRYINSVEGGDLVTASSVEPSKMTTRKPRMAKEVPATAVSTIPEFKSRDFDKENRGKVKSLFLEALLSNPNVISSLSDVDGLNGEEIQAALNKLVETVF